MAVGVLDTNHVLVLKLRGFLGQALLHNSIPQSSLEELVEAEKVLADVYARQRRGCGPSYPDTLFTQSNLETARGAIARIKARVLEMTRAALDAKTSK